MKFVLFSILAVGLIAIASVANFGDRANASIRQNTIILDDRVIQETDAKEVSTVKASHPEPELAPTKTIYKSVPVQPAHSRTDGVIELKNGSILPDIKDTAKSADEKLASNIEGSLQLHDIGLIFNRKHKRHGEEEEAESSESTRTVTRTRSEATGSSVAVGEASEGSRPGVCTSPGPMTTVTVPPVNPPETPPATPSTTPVRGACDCVAAYTTQPAATCANGSCSEKHSERHGLLGLRR